MLGRLFSLGRRDTPTRPIVPNGAYVYAIGDIHGRLDLLKQLHVSIREHAASHPSARRVAVYVGDYVDRGADSRGVIDLLLDEPLSGFETIHLMGNHEKMLLDFLEQPALGKYWMNLGGRETLASYGVNIPRTINPTPENFLRMREDLRRLLPARHLEFLRDLQLWHLEGDYLFVHAGIRPGVPLDEQNTDDLLSIREPFLNSPTNHRKVVVHGHSISALPEVRPNRIGIDTGAFASGRLTCLALTGDRRQFLSTGPTGPVTGHGFG